ncbi:MAG TPA: alpha/beta hydrolase [Trebonia sp.]|jgi:pimeloyl-ACP methyl ester carboxylesterase|nr:alpha/beta hydrolase [Trebonia sp.]
MWSSRRPGVRAVAAAAAALLTLAVTACTGSGVTPGNSSASGDASGGSNAGIVPVASTLHWHSCAGQLQGLECGSVQVPVNYADPNGRKLTLALSMQPATAPLSQQQGILLVNPGGPGASGLSLAGAVAQGISPQAAADYDIVGFDPRGVGSSVPELSCDPTFFSGVRPDYIPAGASTGQTPAAGAEQADINRAKTYAADCEKRFGWLLPYMTTENVARDMDSIRKAFGVSKINYYAFSYGTYIGQVYATLFPDRVRRMVLDSTVDPNGVWWSDNIDQDYAFQGRQDAFFAWTAKYDAYYHLGSTTAEVQANWYKARAMLKARPIDGPDGTPMIGEDEFDDTFLLGGYLDTLWPGLAQALSAYVTSGGTQTSLLVSQYEANGTQNENEFAVYNAVQCSDAAWPTNWSYWNSVTEKVYKTAPFEAWDNAWYNASCAFWPVKGPSKPLQIDGKGLPPILMLQGTLDPATPYAGAQEAHKLLPSARMVVVEGGGNHGQSLEYPPNNCVQNYLNDYLSTGAVPEQPGLVNATCPAVPAPTPTSS